MKKGSKVAIVTITTLLVIAIIVLICLLVMKNQKDSNPEESTTNIENTNISENKKNEEKVLTSEELKEIEDYIKNNNKSLFLVPEYKEASEIDLYFQIRYINDKELKVQGASKAEEAKMYNKEFNANISEEDIDRVKNELPMSFVINKYTKNSLNKYLKENLDVNINDVDLSFLTYLDESDAYFMIEPTDAFEFNFKFVSGKVLNNGMYEIKYTQEDVYNNFKYNWTLTLEKNGEKYVFVSNVNDLSNKIENISKTPGLSKQRKAYSASLDCEIYYKNNTIYYAKLISNENIPIITTHYFENGEYLISKADKGTRLKPYNYEDYVADKIIELFKNNEL